MKPLARVLYENQRNEARSYPLHELVCAMVDDRLGRGGQFATVKVVEGWPRKGKDKLLRDCRAVDPAFAGLAPDRRFALIDADRLAADLGLLPSADLAAIREALTDQIRDVQMFTPDAERRQDSNTEEIVRVAGRCLGLPADDPTLREALNKDLIARDRILSRAARSGQPGVRECMRVAQPSLGRLVDALAAIVGAGPTPTPSPG